MSAAVTAGDVSLRAALRHAWEHLPVLLVGTVGVCAPVLAAVLLAGPSPVAGAAVLVLGGGPAATALVAVATRVVDDGATDHVGVADWAGALRRGYRRGLVLAAIPTALALLTWSALLARAAGGGEVMAIPALAGASMLVLVVVAATVLLPLWADEIAHDRAPGPRTRGLAAWVLALRTLAAAPLGFVAALALAAVGAVGTATVSHGLVLAVPAPVALVLVVALRAARR